MRNHFLPEQLNTFQHFLVRRPFGMPEHQNQPLAPGRLPALLDFRNHFVRSSGYQPARSNPLKVPRASIGSEVFEKTQPDIGLVKPRYKRPPLFLRLAFCGRDPGAPGENALCFVSVLAARFSIYPPPPPDSLQALKIVRRPSISDPARAL